MMNERRSLITRPRKKEEEEEEIDPMEEEKTKNKRIKEDFSRVSFRVVIHNILPFLEVEVDELKKITSLFGYFKKDKFRKIFFLFPSLRYTSGKLGKFSVELKKIESLFLEGEFSFSQLSRNLESMTQLRTLSFIAERDYYLKPKCQEISKFFSTPNFPKIRSLTIEIFDKENDYYFDFDWNVGNNLWRNIELFRLYIHEESLKDNFLPSFQLPEVRDLVLDNEVFEKNYEVACPNFEELFLCGCKNLRVLSINKLKVICYSGNHPNILQDLNIRKTEFIRILSSMKDEENCVSIDWIFAEYKYNLKELHLAYIKLPHLRKLSLREVTFRGDKEYQWCRNLVSLKFIYPRCFDGSFFLRNKESLNDIKEFEFDAFEASLTISSNVEDYPNIKELQEFLERQRICINEEEEEEENSLLEKEVDELRKVLTIAIRKKYEKLLEEELRKVQIRMGNQLNSYEAGVKKLEDLVMIIRKLRGVKLFDDEKFNNLLDKKRKKKKKKKIIKSKIETRRRRGKKVIGKTNTFAYYKERRMKKKKKKKKNSDKKKKRKSKK